MSQFPDTRLSLIVEIQSPENRGAWAEFVMLYRPVIYRMARKQGMQDADAQDLAQSVLMRIAGAIDRWKKTDTSIGFRNWLSRIAKNAILSALSRPSRVAGIGGTDIQDLIDQQPSVDQGVERAFAMEYLREKYHRAAASVQTDVDAITWQAFEMSVVEGKPCVEVAELLAKPVGTIYAARSRVMRRLRDQVQQMEIDE